MSYLRPCSFKATQKKKNFFLFLKFFNAVTEYLGYHQYTPFTCCGKPWHIPWDIQLTWPNLTFNIVPSLLFFIEYYNYILHLWLLELKGFNMWVWIRRVDGWVSSILTCVVEDIVSIKFHIFLACTKPFFFCFCFCFLGIGYLNPSQLLLSYPSVYNNETLDSISFIFIKKDRDLVGV